MDPLIFILALALGIAVSFGAGALSGFWIGKEALGAELAAFMGGLYGLMSGVVGVSIGLIILLLV